MGMDSIKAIEFRNRIQGIIGNKVSLETSLVFQNPSVQAIRHYIVNKIHLKPIHYPLTHAQNRILFLQHRSEEHTSELQSTNAHLVCRLLLEKKKKQKTQ